MGLEEMTSREVSGGCIIERLTMQLKLTKATLKSASEEFPRSNTKNLETLEKKNKRLVHQMGELKKREFKLISEREEAKESAKEELERVLEMENKQYVKESAAATRVNPEKFSGSGNDRFSGVFGSV